MTSIRQLEEKVFASEVVLMRWNDRMDLLALANNRGEVSLHRLTLQRVWCLMPDKETNTVIDMAWRPDGKIIAIGYSSGKIVLVEVEKKNILREIIIDDDIISCISWQQDKASSDLAKNDSNEEVEDKINMGDSAKFLPDLPSLSNEFPSSTNNPSENLVDLHFVKNQNNLNILIIGTKGGNLHISIFGLFACAKININSILRQQCIVLNAHMSENLNTLYVTVCDDSYLLYIISMDTSILNTHSKELFKIALKHGHLVSLLSYLNSTMSSIVEAWESILLEMDSKLSKYAANVPEGTVTADFLELLMFGIPSDEMEEFLMQDLTDKGLKKMGHSIELSYSNIQKLLLKHLNEVGQHITYHLAELKGMARFTYRNKNLGLDEKTITDAILSNGAFLMKGVEVQQVINNSLSNYRAFFRWLYVVILRLMGEQIPPEIPKMAQQDVTDITEFLQNFDCLGNSSSGQKGRFKLERLGQYLVDAPLTILPKNDGNIWANFLEVNECVAENNLIINHDEAMSLVQQHNQLNKAIENIFIEPNKFVSNNFKYIRDVDCLTVSHPNHLTMSQLNFNDETTLMAIYDRLSANVPKVFYFLEINRSNESNIKGLSWFASQIPEISTSTSCKILDVKFYSQNYLSLLLDDCNNHQQYLCQIPLKFLASNAVNLNLAFGPIFSHSMQHDLKNLDLRKSTGNIIKQIEGMTAASFQVSSSRHVCVVLSDNQRKLQLFEMEADEDEEELDDTFITANTTQDTETMYTSSVTSE